AAMAAGDDSSDAYVILAAGLSGVGRHQEAADAAKRAIDIDQNGRPDQKSTHLMRAYFDYGLELMALGRVNESIAPLEKAASLEPAMADVWYSLGNAYRKLRQPDAAVMNFQKAVQVKPGHAEAWVNMGITLMEAGRTQEARQALERGRELAKPDSEADRLANRYLQRL
ncbi:MAG TPA: tetratricopeptide repeat protein, partial [Phycisphaerales bacterium]|nr:tetratricopeptide repeat protein [Phycisphaerales bacterium]